MITNCKNRLAMLLSSRVALILMRLINNYCTLELDNDNSSDKVDLDDIFETQRKPLRISKKTTQMNLTARINGQKSSKIKY